MNGSAAAPASALSKGRLIQRPAGGRTRRVAWLVLVRARGVFAPPPLTTTHPHTHTKWTSRGRVSGLERLAAYNIPERGHSCMQHITSARWRCSPAQQSARLCNSVPMQPRVQPRFVGPMDPFADGGIKVWKQWACGCVPRGKHHSAFQRLPVLTHKLLPHCCWTCDIQ